MISTQRLIVWIALLGGVVLAFVFAARYTKTVTDALNSRPVDQREIQFLKEPVPLPEVRFRTLAGDTLTPAMWRGKVAIINFWATWCHPCRIEIPELIKLQQRYPQHLVVVGVSAEIPGEDLSDDTRSTAIARKFARDWNFNYPVVMQTSALLKVFTGIFGLPASFVIDPNGRIVQKHVGLVSPAIFEQEVRALIGPPVSAAP